MSRFESAVRTAPAGRTALLILGLSASCAGSREIAPRETPTTPKPPAAAPASIVRSLDAWRAATPDEHAAAAALVRAKTSAVHPAGMATGDGPSGGFAVATFRHDATGLEFCLIPGGTYRLGTPRDDDGREPLEAASQDVTIDPFLLCRTEVPQRVWSEVMGANPSAIRGDDLPVDSVTWTESAEFCRRLGMTLPSDVQWECAARGGTATAYYTGRTAATLGGFENVADRSFAPHAREAGVWWHETSVAEIEDRFVTSSPVGSFRPNQFALFDMLGNVSEWCRDSWEQAPVWTGPNPVLTNGDVDQVVRGGSWGSETSGLRCAARRFQAHKHRGGMRGLRPAVEIVVGAD